MSEEEFQSKVLHGISTLQVQVTRLNTAVLGDESAAIRGMAKDIRHHTVRLDEIMPRVAETKVKCDEHEKKIKEYGKFITTTKYAGLFAGGAFLGWPAAWEYIKGHFSK